MDKKWRNLIIIIALVIVVVLGYIYLTQNQVSLPVIESKSINDGYEGFLVLFEKNDVNIDNIQLLNLVYSDENGIINWIEKKDGLLNLKNDLVVFKGNLLEYSIEDRNELSALTDVYIKAIDYSFSSEQEIKSLNVLFKSGFNCSELNKVTDLNRLIIQNYINLYDLAMDVDDFAYNYDPYSELILIELNDSYDYLLTVQEELNNVVIDCEGGKA
ncbi:MAG: hypothetical protein PHY04_02930 [Candidatus ainarchaeum sp.]|jgi:hypothetical protein|nr:hypothetical protein [Candidatus ainarchaeum sp.]